MGVVLVARDVTPHVQLEAERAELRNRRCSRKSSRPLGIWSPASHTRVDNPLQGVLGHLELLRATGAFPKALRRDVHRIYREADRAAKIVRNLLVFADRGASFDGAPVSNARSRACSLLRAPAFRASNIEVVRQHEDGLPRVKGGPLLLQQALLTSCSTQSRRIGPPQGPHRNPTISRRTQRSPFTVVAQIRDTGPGIPFVRDAAASSSRSTQRRRSARARGLGLRLPMASFRNTVDKSRVESPEGARSSPCSSRGTGVVFPGCSRAGRGPSPSETWTRRFSRLRRCSAYLQVNLRTFTG